MSDDKKNPISIDVGLSARAEIKAEIPPAASGRLVDALTDIIRPFTEQRGLRADQIRLQREEVLIEIVQRARARIALEGGPVRPVPNKFLVQFLEKASLEETGSELVEIWSNLLVSASIHLDPNHIYYVSILGQLSAEHCKLLAAIMDNTTSVEVLNSCEALDFDYVRYLDQILAEIGSCETIDQLSAAADKNFKDIPGLSFVHMAVERIDDQEDYYDIEYDAEYTDKISHLYTVLENFGILRGAARSFQTYGLWAIAISFYIVTPFGVQFYRSCRGLAHND
jgi:hypothetical protein